MTTGLGLGFDLRVGLGLGLDLLHRDLLQQASMAHLAGVQCVHLVRVGGCEGVRLRMRVRVRGRRAVLAPGPGALATASPPLAQWAVALPPPEGRQGASWAGLRQARAARAARAARRAARAARGARAASKSTSTSHVSGVGEQLPLELAWSGLGLRARARAVGLGLGLGLGLGPARNPTAPFGRARNLPAPPPPRRSATRCVPEVRQGPSRAKLRRGQHPPGM
eukprot:scaffold59822_cov44-Phaeocystis_antarctica.AAC.2